jgi:hypothetical protein
MDVVPAAEATTKGPSMMPRAVAARREAVQRNDQHIVLVKEAVAKALADYTRPVRTKARRALMTKGARMTIRKLTCARNC